MDRLFRERRIETKGWTDLIDAFQGAAIGPALLVRHWMYLPVFVYKDAKVSSYESFHFSNRRARSIKHSNGL